MGFNLSLARITSALMLTTALLFASKCYAQTHEPSFKLIPGNDGISLGKINGMVRDSHGVMWFIDQTNGLISYDGVHMTAFPHDSQNPNSLGGPQPEDIIIDSTDVIWISFWGSGLDRFNPDSGEFTHFRHQQNDETTVSNDSISSILIDHLGNFWVGTHQGLDLFDQKMGTFKHYRHNAQDQLSLSHNLVRKLCEDREGTLWVGTGMAWDTHNKGGLNKLNRDKGNFTRYLNDPKDPQSLINNKVRVIFEDSRGNFWVGTNGDGLHTMDRKSGKFTRHLNDPKKPQQLSRPPVKSISDHINFITEDVEGQIWIGTWGNGINRYNPATKEITYFGNNIGGLTDVSFWAAISYGDGLFWLSTDVPSSNLYQVDLFTNNIPLITVSGAIGINRFYQDEPNVLWIASAGGGLIRKDLLSGDEQIFKNEPANPKSLSGNTVSSMLKDKKGNYWISTDNGLNQLNPNTGTFIRYQHLEGDKQSLVEGEIIVLYEDHASNIWIGAVNGLDMLDQKTGKFTHYAHTNDTSSIGGNIIPGIYEYKPGDLWVGAWNGGGLNRLDATTGKFKHYLKGKSVGQIYKDHANVVWVSSIKGVYRYNPTTDEFSLISNDQAGFEIEEVRSIMEDDENNLWLSTNTGIIKVNKDRNLFTKYGKENGINQFLWYLSRIKTLDGQLLYGTDGGYYAFKPSELKINPLLPKVEFTNFWIGNESVKANSEILEGSLDSVKEIHLSYDQTVFSVGLSVTDYSNAEFRKVVYSLDGYDIGWRQPGSEGRAYYFNVPPGKYTFTMKAFNSSNGAWQQKSIAIVISPPWWRTWWAYGSFGIAFVGFVFSVDRFQRKRLLERAKAEAKEKELAQAKEIEKAYTELKATQSQLIQSEKMASLGELTAGIAHEIQNPLNFVNNFSEVNKELLLEMNDELNSGNLNEAKLIARSIIDNEEKIIFHGKRADGIVKGMLQHSRSSSGIKEPTDVNVLADEYLRLAYHGLRAKDKSFNATMKTDFDESLGKINAIPQDLGRVILNLITNAFYAVAERKTSKSLTDAQYEPTVTVRTKRQGNKVEISVSDNGNGIPRAIIDKIFQPFFTTKPSGKGTGLGLSMSYEIVTKGHGGELKVETKEHEGTTFIIILPN